MQESQLVRWTKAVPFEPFSLFLADGRRVDAKSPENLLLGEYASVLYVFHLGGQVEVLDAAHVVSIRTLASVDPTPYMK